MARAKGRGRGRGGTRGGRGRGRGRNKKMIIDSDEEQETMETSDTGENQTETNEEEESSPVEEPVDDAEINKDNSVEFNIDDDISQLVPPTFSTISKGPPQPMLELSWDHQYLPMGEKVASPNIHMCISCKLPIRLYGRLIPCKHVFCYSCAVKQGDRCSCCEDRVTRIEKAPLGNVFMCLHGGIQFGYDGCRRTYLSQRDLQAHFNHRHKPRPNTTSSNSSVTSAVTTTAAHEIPSTIQTTPTNLSSHRQSIPVHFSSTRSNLISVPLQSGPAGAGLRKDSHVDNRFDRKSNTQPYSRNPSGWGSFRPY